MQTFLLVTGFGILSLAIGSEGKGRLQMSLWEGVVHGGRTEGVGGFFFTFNSLSYHISFSPSLCCLWVTARYRLQYCLKESKPQTSNHQHRNPQTVSVFLCWWLVVWGFKGSTVLGFLCWWLVVWGLKALQFWGFYVDGWLFGVLKALQFWGFYVDGWLFGVFKGSTVLGFLCWWLVVWGLKALQFWGFYVDGWLFGV